MVISSKEKVKVAKSSLKLNSIPKEWRDNFLNLFPNLKLSPNELRRLILGGIRGQECSSFKKSKRYGHYSFSHHEISEWLKNRVIPNTVIVTLSDVDFYRLLVFSILISYKMLKGETKMTITEFSFRGKQRSVMQVISDVFIGKIGEIAFKRFAEKFGFAIEVDWSIGTHLEEFRSDLTKISKLNSTEIKIVKSIISIKSTKSLEGAWAEAPKGSELGILCKAVLPEDFFLRVMQHISSFTKMMDFIKIKVKDDSYFNNLMLELEKEVSSELSINTYIVGSFIPSNKDLFKKGKDIPFLGSVNEEKHFLLTGKLSWEKDHWEKLLDKIYTSSVSEVSQ